MARILLIDTSQRVGRIGLARDARLLSECVLEEARRHARDLAPAVQHLLAEQGWTAKDLGAVLVNRGPGSYTGLRVGLMSAKALAYAIGCPVVGLEGFTALARQVPAEALTVEVWADAQQDRVYAQRFVRVASGSLLVAADPMTVAPVEDRLALLTEAIWLTGPGLELQAPRLPPGTRRTAACLWHARLENLLVLGLERLERGERDDPFVLEPLYLRPSAAEEKWPGRQGSSRN